MPIAYVGPFLSVPVLQYVYVKPSANAARPRPGSTVEQSLQPIVSKSDGHAVGVVRSIVAAEDEQFVQERVG